MAFSTIKASCATSRFCGRRWFTFLFIILSFLLIVEYLFNVSSHFVYFQSSKLNDIDTVTNTVTESINYRKFLQSHTVKVAENSTTTEKTKTVISESSVLEPVCGYLFQTQWPLGPRLGNQLFLYASFYSIAKKQKSFANKTAFIPISDTFLSFEKLFQNLSIPKQILPKSWFASKPFPDMGDENCCIYYKIDFDQILCDGKNVNINGLKQSYKYFENDFEEIKKEFTFEKSIQENCNRLFNEHLTNLSKRISVKVGIHLRRGDFVTKTHIGFVPARVDYLKKAIEYHENSTKEIDCLIFLIIGDDYEWNKNAINEVRFKRPNDTFFILIDSKKSTPEIDLCMMRLCDHISFSTGSFGWWAGFFSGGIVTYQKEYAVIESPLYYAMETKDYFLPHWVAL